jgi:chorismate mutase/prephenate dehydratase
MLELSRSYQQRILGRDDSLTKSIRAAIEGTPALFPDRVTVACQGVEGSNSQIACERLFANPDILYFSDFGAVFTAVEKGLCRYGVIPVENSSAGSVNKVYDLMMRHNFKIVRSARIKIDHNLLARPGTKLEDIKEIYTHEQAISQCSVFLEKLKGVKVTAVENTAAAAAMVAESGRNDIAALASRPCIELYGLTCLASCVQNEGNNYTRFICISRELEIYPGADRTSLMLTIAHRPGTLYKTLQRFYAYGINLLKIESRAIPDRNFEFLFYFDIETSIYSPQFIQLMTSMNDICEEMHYLGSYSEVV